MNSRSVSDNLVNFSTDLATTLNQLDSKEPLLSFPFDHLYACSESGDRRQTLHLKEVEISTHCVLPHQEKHVNQRLASLENQNKKLKDLLIYHLDLIQQQNELMSKREKALLALRQENDTLKSKVSRAGVEKRVSAQNALISQPVHVPATATVTSVYKTDVPTSTNHSHLFRNTFNEVYYDNSQTSTSAPYAYNTNLSSPKPTDIFGLDRPSDTVPELQNYFTTDLSVPSILEVSPLATEPPSSAFAMIDNKRPKRGETKTEPNKEPKYIVTTSSGHARISRNRKRSTGIGSFSRMPKTKPAPKPEKSTIYDNEMFSVNKQTKTTYGKSKLGKYGYTALQERLQLIEPTPSGEDPYQIGEAEMREQSPIPKLMLQKTNHGRLRICSETTGGVTSTITSTTSSRRIYDTMSTSSRAKRSKLGDNFLTASSVLEQNKDTASSSVDEDVDVEKTDSDVDWSVFSTSNTRKQTSLCDFSYGETLPLDISRFDFPDFFEPGPVNADSSGVTEAATPQTQQAAEKNKKRGARTTSLAGPLDENKDTNTKRAQDTKRGRKRALSTAASIKRGDNAQQKAPAKRARRAVRAKKSPVPGMMTKKVYHTCMGDPDLSWYLGLDPDIKKDDCDPTDNTSSNVEVPRWREKPVSSSNIQEGTENLDDRAFEKRHQKLEAEERRQLRWHMRRIREQRHVERLRQRQRDPWGPNSSQQHSRGEYTVWPQPIRDLQYIEITDTVPVTAFGEDVPALPENSSGFIVPWVRTSKALKRSKRSKTLH